MTRGRDGEESVLDATCMSSRRISILRMRERSSDTPPSYGIHAPCATGWRTHHPEWIGAMLLTKGCSTRAERRTSRPVPAPRGVHGTRLSWQSLTTRWT